MSEITYLPGLSGIEYTGYYDGNTQWFLTATPTGDTEIRSNFDPVYPVPDNGFSWEWTGYFKPLSAEGLIEDDFTFSMYSDDIGIMWIGDTAISGYTTANRLVSAFDTYEQSTSIALRADTYYPVRIQFGHPVEPTAISLNIQANPTNRQANDFVEGNLFYSTGQPVTGTCDPSYDIFAVSGEDGCHRARRLWHLGYI
jgi:hypothetical protein